MTHTPPCATCEGCQARVRQTKHFMGSFEASLKDHSVIITIDQVTVPDFDYTAGYGGFKYGISFCSLRTEYWDFIKFRPMGYAHAAFGQFCIIRQLRSKEVVVYFDARQSLKTDLLY